MPIIIVNIIYTNVFKLNRMFNYSFYFKSLFTYFRDFSILRVIFIVKAKGIFA